MHMQHKSVTERGTGWHVHEAVCLVKYGGARDCDLEMHRG